MIMSNTIPLKEKLDFQQYQLVINALSNIGIEIAIPEDVAHGHENELAGATLGENEQLFKIELPVVAPLFLTDKRGGELVLLTKEAYERFSLKEKELQILSTETYDKLLRKEKELEEFTKEAYNKLSLKEKELEAVSQKLSFKEKELDVLKRDLQENYVEKNSVEPQNTPITIVPQSAPAPMAAQNTPEPVVAQSTAASLTTADPLSATDPFVPQIVMKNITFEEVPEHPESTSSYEESTSSYEESTSSYEESTSSYEESTSSYQEPVARTTPLYQSSNAPVSLQEAVERARSILEKYNK